MTIIQMIILFLLVVLTLNAIGLFIIYRQAKRVGEMIERDGRQAQKMQRELEKLYEDDGK